MKIVRIISVIVFSSFVASANIAFAAHDDYYANYYEDEGDLLFKIRGFYLHTSTKPTNFPASVAAKEKPGALVQLGYGVDTATTYFFTDNIAAELSLGIGMMKVIKSEFLSKKELKEIIRILEAAFNFSEKSKESEVDFYYLGYDRNKGEWYDSREEEED